MLQFRSKGLAVALGLFVTGALVLGGCSPAAQVAAASLAAQAATVAPVQAPTGATQPGTLPQTNPSAVAPAPQTSSAGRTITVVGHGEVKTQPAVAHSNIGIEVTSDTVAAATKDAQAKMDAVIKALKAAGVADKDIQTSNFSIYLERQPGVPQPLPAGQGKPLAPAATGGVYHVNNQVSVTIRDLTKVGPVIDAAINAGANNIYGINFGLDDTTALQSEARQKAIADAKARAQSLAQLTGVQLGNVVAVSEVIGQAGPVIQAAAAAPVGMGGGGTPVESGELTFSTDIQVVYAIQ